MRCRARCSQRGAGEHREDRQRTQDDLAGAVSPRLIGNIGDIARMYMGQAQPEGGPGPLTPERATFLWLPLHHVSGLVADPSDHLPHDCSSLVCRKAL